MMLETENPIDKIISSASLPPTAVTHTSSSDPFDLIFEPLQPLAPAAAPVSPPSPSTPQQKEFFDVFCHYFALDPDQFSNVERRKLYQIICQHLAPLMQGIKGFMNQKEYS